MANDDSAGNAPIAPRSSRGHSRRTVLWILLGLGALGMGAMLLFRTAAPPQPDATKALPDPVADSDEPVVHNPGYVGIQACSPCHARRVTDFLKTGHFNACRLPEPGTMAEGFAPGRGTHASLDPAVRFEMAQSGNDFQMTTIADPPAGAQRTASRIGLVYGKGKLDEVYFSWTGNRLFELPVSWLHPSHEWGHTNLSHHSSGSFAREATTRCLECHTTWFEHTPGTANEYNPSSFLIGVTCERCHGPAREHVDFHKAHPQADTATAIVRPHRLSRERQLEVCTQCHSNATKSRKPAFTYRPGEALDTCFRTIDSKHPEGDHVANQIKYLRESKCFQKSDALTCTTCHDPHRPHEPAEEHAGDRSCLKCHQPANCTDRERLPVAVRDNCASCHMPPQVWMNVLFHTDEDKYMPPIRRFQHRIAVYPDARQTVLLEWYRTQSDEKSKREAARLSGLLVERWSKESDDRRRDYRFLAAIGAIREALRIDPTEPTRAKLRELLAIQSKLDADMNEAVYQIDRRRPAVAVDTLNAILTVKPDWAKAHGKLGTAYAMTGQNDLAQKHLQLVAKYDPEDPYGYNMLGWLAYLQDKAEESVISLRKADEIQPFDSHINYRLGLALTKWGKFSEAAERFRHVLVIDPTNAGGCQGLSNALGKLGRFAEAVPFAERAARYTEERNPDVLLSLADAYAGAGRWQDASDAADKALSRAQESDPNLVPQIRERLSEFRLRTGR